MPSNLIKKMPAIAGLSPAFLLLYIIKIIEEFKQLTFYIHTSSMEELIKGTKELLATHYLLFIFMMLVLLACFIIRFARKNFSIGRIIVKSIKPADNNFMTILFSFFSLFAKLTFPGISNTQLVAILLLVPILFAFTFKSSYHHNATLKLLLGYSHYEVQTNGKVTYRMLSRKKLINR